MSLALNCNTHSNEDVEVISNLVRMRLKTKPLANHYINCIKYVDILADIQYSVLECSVWKAVAELFYRRCYLCHASKTQLELIESRFKFLGIKD